MAVSADRVRELALALEGSSEAPHMHRAAFRTPRKIFITLGEQTHDVTFMLDPDLRDFYCEQAPEAFSPVPGGWGRMGMTACNLKAVDEPTFASALGAAFALAQPRPKAKRR